MGDKHIYDIIGLRLPDHPESCAVTSINRRTNYEAIADALERCFKDLGFRSGSTAILPDKKQLLEKEGLHCRFRKVRL